MLQRFDQFEHAISDIRGDVGKSYAHAGAERVLIRLRTDPGYDSFCRQPFTGALRQ